MYRPESYYTNSDGWQTPSNGTYVREDGTKFSVPLKTCHTSNGTYSSYGGYTNDELKKYDKEQR